MTREAGQRTFLIVGSPWLTAIAAIRDESIDEDPWQARGSFRPGDLLITVLDTDPRAVLCVERVDKGDSDDDPVVLGERRMTANLPPICEVEARAAAVFPEQPGPIPARDADRLLDAIGMADARLSFEPFAEKHGALAEPYVRLNAGPECLLCDQPVDPGNPETGVYVGAQTDAQPDVDALLCIECCGEMADSPHATLVEHRIVTRHPQCPRCAAFRSLYVALGKLQLPPDIAPRWPWEIATGDSLDGSETQWHCAACGYGWEYVFSDLAPSRPGQNREVAPLWDRNLDNRIVLGRRRKDGSSFEPMSVLCAPLQPVEVMRTLAAIVDTTFAGSWDAALSVMVDPSIAAWEFLDHAVNEFSESIGDRARDVQYSGEPVFSAVPGVGINTDYGPYDNTEIEIGDSSYDFYDVMYAFVIDDDGVADILDPRTQHEVVVGGRIMTSDDETWVFSHTLMPADYR